MLNAWLATFLLASSDQLFHKNSGKILFHIFIMLLIPGGSPPIVLFHPGLCGTDYPATSPPGRVSVWPASEAKSTASHGWPSNPSPSHSMFFSPSCWFGGPLQYSNNFNYIFTIIDRTSKWMESVPFSGMSMVACSKALTFLGFPIFLVCPKRSLQIVGHNLLPTLASTLRDALHLTSANNHLSSRVERCSWKTAPLPQGCSSRTRRHGDMVSGITLCTPWTPCTAEGRHWSFPGWGQFWRSNCVA